MIALSLLSLRTKLIAAAVAALVALGLSYHLYAVASAYRSGYAAHKNEVEMSNAEARKRAEDEQRRLRSGDDGRVRQFDRD